MAITQIELYRPRQGNGDQSAIVMKLWIEKHRSHKNPHIYERQSDIYGKLFGISKQVIQTVTTFDETSNCSELFGIFFSAINNQLLQYNNGSNEFDLSIFKRHIIEPALLQISDLPKDNIEQIITTNSGLQHKSI